MKKRMTAVLLAVCLIVGSTGILDYGQSVLASNESGTSVPQKSMYDSVTFRDFGIRDGTYTHVATGTLGYRAHLDGVLLSGYLNTEDGTMLYGGSNGLTIAIQEGTFKINDYAFASENVVLGTDVFFQLTTDYVDEDVKIGVWIEEKFLGYQTIAGLASLLDASLSVGDVNSKIRVCSEAADEMFVELTTSDWNLADGTYTSGDVDYTTCRTNATPTVDGKMMSMYVALNADNGGSELRYGGANSAGWTGVRWIRNAQGTDYGLQFINIDGRTMMSLVGKENTSTWQAVSVAKNIPIGTYIKLGIITKIINGDADNAKDDLRIGLFINDEFYANYCVIDGADDIGPYMRAAAAGSVGVKKVTQSIVYDDEGYPTAYTHKTTSNYYKEDNVALTSNMYVDLGDADYDALMFGVNVKLQAGNQIYYAAPSSAWVGLKLLVNSGGTLTITHNRTNTDPNPLKGASYMLSGIPLDTVFNLKLTTDLIDYDGDGEKDDVKLGVWVNDVLVENTYLYLADYAPCLHNGFYLIPNGTMSYYWSKPMQNMQLQSVAYDLSKKSEQEGYLVTSNGSVTVNGSATENGTVLNTPGNYIVVKAETSAVYTQEVALYKPGDVDLNGTQADSDDKIALLAVISDEGAYGKAGRLAADLNHDGAVDSKDLAILDEILAEKTTLEQVRKTYDSDSQSYDYLGGDTVMPIAGYYGPYRRNNDGTVTDFVQDNLYQCIADSGINLINYSFNDYTEDPQAVLDELELAEKYHLGMYIRDSGIVDLTTETAIAERIAKYSQYNSYLGMELIDEPMIFDTYNPWNDDSLMPGGANYKLKSMDTYLNISKRLNAFGNTGGFMNLLGLSRALYLSKWALIFGQPTTEDAATIATKYKAYLNKAITDGGVKSLSYDNYPFTGIYSDVTTMVNGDSGTLVENTGCQQYFKNLAMIREASQKGEIPFWTYVSIGGDFGNRETNDAGKYVDTHEAALPTESEMHWQVNIPLAFGSKGIEYFTLIQPAVFSYTSDTTGAIRDYTRVGLIGINGKKNPRYYDVVTDINAQIAAVDYVLMKSTNTGIIIAESSKNTSHAYANMAVMEDVVTQTPLRTSTELLQSVSVEDNNAYGAVVGCFDYQGKEAFYVVNYDTSSTQNVTLNFASEVQYQCVQDAKTTDGTNSQCTLTIPAGEAVLVVVGAALSYEKEYLDISTYRKESGQHEAPMKEGYLFAGWFTDATCTTSIPSNQMEGYAYAKFVDESILGVKAQAKYTYHGSQDKGDIRLITSIDSERYNLVGFKVTFKGTTKYIVSDTAYEKLTGWDGTTVLTYEPTVFSSSSKYFYAFIITAFDSKDFDEDIEITAFWRTLDGTYVYGCPSTKRIEQGLSK